MVYITGDLHGDRERFKEPQFKKLKRGDTLIVCGDFGFLWTGSAEEEKILTKLSKSKYNLCFIDGTHENFGLLNKREVSEWHGGKVHHLGGNLYHLMRGQIFDLEGLSIFTMGGGESPDLELRIQNNTWFREESPSQQELLEGAENIEKHGNRVDVIVTHEPSARIKDFLQLKSGRKTRLTVLNSYLEELADSCEYSKWFFGSLHTDKHISSANIAVFRDVLNARTGKSILRE